MAWWSWRSTRLDARRAFLSAHGELRSLVEGRSAGFALALCGPDGPETAWLQAEDGDVARAVVGAHGECTLGRGAVGGLELRHALVLHCGAVLRVVDLRTTEGLVGEEGGRWRNVEASGPVFLRLGSHWLIALPAGTDLAQDPEQAWRRLPSRTYCNASSALRRLCWRRGGLDSLVTTLPGILTWHRALVDFDEVPRGEIRVRSEVGEARLRVGTRALRQGIVIGRSARCDSGGVPVLRNPGVSRIHALVVDLGGGLHVVDAASKNGLSAHAQRVESCRLEWGSVAEIGGDIATLRFVPVQ